MQWGVPVYVPRIDIRALLYEKPRHVGQSAGGRSVQGGLLELTFGVNIGALLYEKLCYVGLSADGGSMQRGMLELIKGIDVRALLYEK